MGGPGTTGGYKDYINCGNVLGNGTTYSSGENFTYEAWACDHGSETTWKTIIGSSSYAQIYFWGGSSKIRMFKNGGGVGGSELLTTDGQLHEWFHIVGTYNGQSLNQSFSGTMTSDGPIRRKLYVNGNMVDSDRESFFGGNIGDSYIGSYHANGLERAPMELAVARIYNRELSHEEIKQNYNAQKSRIDAIPKIAKPANLVLYLDAGMFESYKGSGSGTTIYDLSGNGNDGTIDGATYPANTVLPENDMGRYFDFDGTNDEIVVGDAGTLDLTTQMTQELWLYADSFTHGGGGNFPTVISKSSQNYRIYFNTSGQIVVRNNVDGVQRDLNSSTNLSTGIWYHIVVTKSTTGFSLYVDGELNNSNTRTGSITTNSSALVIGNWDEGGVRAWDGKVAMVRIYNVALSADEVMQNYNYSKHRFGQ